MATSSVPAPLQPDDLTEIGRSLVETAREIVAQPDRIGPFGGSRLLDLKSALGSMRELQRIHRDAKKGIQADEIHKIRVMRERTWNDTARANRGAAISRYRAAIQKEKLGFLAKRLDDKRIEKIEADVKRIEATRELYEERTKRVRLDAELATERHDADYPVVPPSESSGSGSGDETIEAYFSRRSREASDQPEVCAPVLGAAAGGDEDTGGDSGGPEESDVGGESESLPRGESGGA